MYTFSGAFVFHAFPSGVELWALRKRGPCLGGGFLNLALWFRIEEKGAFPFWAGWCLDKSISPVLISTRTFAGPFVVLVRLRYTLPGTRSFVTLSHGVKFQTLREGYAYLSGSVSTFVQSVSLVGSRVRGGWTRTIGIRVCLSSEGIYYSWG